MPPWNRGLSVVSPTDPPPAPAPEKPKTLTESANAGDTRALLVAMRERVAKSVENPNTPARDLAALTKRLIEVQRDIEAWDARELEEGERGVVADEAFDASAI